MEIAGVEYGRSYQMSGTNPDDGSIRSNPGGQHPPKGKPKPPKIAPKPPKIEPRRPPKGTKPSKGA